MFIMKNNSKFAVTLARRYEIDLLLSVGVEGIKSTLSNEETAHVLQLLVDSNYLPEGNY